MSVTTITLKGTLGRVNLGATIPSMSPRQIQLEGIYRQMLAGYLTAPLGDVKRAINDFARKVIDNDWLRQMAKSDIGVLMGGDFQRTRDFYRALLRGMRSIHYQRSREEPIPTAPPVVTPPSVPPTPYAPPAKPEDRPGTTTAVGLYLSILNSAMDSLLQQQGYRVRPKYVWYIPRNMYDRFLLEIGKKANAEGKIHRFSYHPTVVEDAFQKRGYEPSDDRNPVDVDVSPSPYDNAATFRIPTGAVRVSAPRSPKGAIPPTAPPAREPIPTPAPPAYRELPPVPEIPVYRDLPPVPPAAAPQPPVYRPPTMRPREPQAVYRAPVTPPAPPTIFPGGKVFVPDPEYPYREGQPHVAHYFEQYRPRKFEPDDPTALYLYIPQITPPKAPKIPPDIPLLPRRPKMEGGEFLPPDVPHPRNMREVYEFTLNKVFEALGMDYLQRPSMALDHNRILFIFRVWINYVQVQYPGIDPNYRRRAVNALKYGQRTKSSFAGQVYLSYPARSYGRKVLAQRGYTDAFLDEIAAALRALRKQAEQKQAREREMEKQAGQLPPPTDYVASIPAQNAYDYVGLLNRALDYTIRKFHLRNRSLADRCDARGRLKRIIWLTADGIRVYVKTTRLYIYKARFKFRMQDYPPGLVEEALAWRGVRLKTGRGLYIAAPKSSPYDLTNFSRRPAVAVPEQAIRPSIRIPPPISTWPSGMPLPPLPPLA